ncbi:Cyclin-B2-5 [Capsicum annuum]|uniref:Cyclin-B2-5 n=1 Tax=Capsicum annuum TaxID=4072 RepID=A0A2G3AJ80_CAPAN|nr:Cyclin-B2-5 [Capsicum annuum]
MMEEIDRMLVGITALLLTYKYEEVSVPIVEDLILIFDKVYARKEVLKMENFMVNSLHFNMTIPITYVFMWWFLIASQYDKKVELMSFFSIKLCIVEYEMLRFPPSMLPAVAVFTAQCTLGLFWEWNATCEKHKNYRKKKILECSKLMVSFHQKVAVGNLTGMHRKYNMSNISMLQDVNQLLFCKKPSSKIRRIHEGERHALPVVVLNEIIDVCATYVISGSGEGGRVFLSSFATERTMCLFFSCTLFDIAGVL